jgi:hypothetical protein
MSGWLCFSVQVKSKGLSGFGLALVFLGQSDLKDLLALVWVCFGFGLALVLWSSY